jgi:hypothetical protein
MIKKLRRKYPVFTYKRYKVKLVGNDLKLSFSFSIDPGIKFNPEVIIRNVEKKRFSQTDSNVVDNFAFHLGLMEIPSYWKSTCSPEILISAGYLDEDQIRWWKDLLLKGMGQFFYENKVDFKKEKFVVIHTEGKQNGANAIGRVENSKTLVPIGGGKDSAVTLDILNKKTKRLGAFVLNPTPASLATIKAANVHELIRVEREIHPRLIELNSEGYLNGHTPFSAYLAFLSTFISYLFNYKNVALSNEASSNEGNVSYLGEEINHQYSKTFEFENKFRNYNKKYLSNINYFSFLRPLYEIQISKIFSRMNKYFDVIRSCNVGQKNDSWCCQCPKCLSTFILLYPFLGPKEIMRIFPENLFENSSLFPILEALVSESKVKPFECVATREEIKVALYLSMKSWSEKLPSLLKLAKQRFLMREKNLKRRSARLLGSWDKNNNLSVEFRSMLKNIL